LRGSSRAVGEIAEVGVRLGKSRKLGVLKRRCVTEGRVAIRWTLSE